MKSFRIVAPIVFLLGLVALYFLLGADEEKPATAAPTQQFQVTQPPKDYDFKK
jgi:hypothetical protein